MSQRSKDIQRKKPVSTPDDDAHQSSGGSAGYELLDSGEGEKLERYGSKLLRRPSSLCCWRKRTPERWDAADARFDPDSGWHVRGEKFASWKVQLPEMQLTLQLQRNGQVGFFPEHLTTLQFLDELLARAPRKQIKVLNLFAFTGLASVFCVQRGASICHLDISKQALDWANQNFRLNELPSEKIRVICDDALVFLEREVKRENKYDIVIADPPTFSRLNKSDSWDLDNIVTTLIERCLKVLHPKDGALLFSSHHAALPPEVISNVAGDYVAHDSMQSEGAYLTLVESESQRQIPAGTLTCLSYGGFAP